MATSELKVAGETTAPEAAPKGLPCVQLPCPCCGEPSANLSLNLWALDSDEGHFTCQECSTDFTAGDVQNFIRQWTPFLRWLEQIPAPAAE